MSEQQEVMIDPRLEGVDDQFKAIIGGIGAAFGGIAQASMARATHTLGTTARGTLTVLAEPEIPAHHYLEPEYEYPVLVRHANIKGFPDDAIRDGRGITLRLLDADADSPTDELDFNKAVLDVLASTGPCFFLNNAATFAQWVASSMDDRKAMLTAFPRITPIFEQIVKNPDSYTQLHYYSETTYQFIAKDGCSYFMRYRILNADKEPDTGQVPADQVMLPQDYIPRPEDDQREKTYLRDDFHDRVTSKDGVKYLVQMQLRPLSFYDACNELAKDCTVAWDEPFLDVARIHLTEMVCNTLIEPLSFSPYHAPPELGLIYARSATDMASINHLRSLVYEYSAKMRNGDALPPQLAALLPKQA